jgi:DNA helicase-2/ATP-dependent DNA helicase PcrA
MPHPLDGLDPGQRAAVVHQGGPLLVEGEAGTGKTTVLAHRVAWLAGEGLPPHAALVLTGSLRAALDLRSRIEVLLHPAWEELAVATPATWAERVLREHSADAGLDPLWALVTPADRVALLLDRLEELTLRHHEIRGSPAPLLARVVRRIDRLKEEAITFDDYASWAGELAALARDDAERVHAVRELEFARLYADHDRLLAARGALDRGGAVLALVRLLRERPHVRAALAARYRHVVVDDHQDTGLAASLVVALLAGEHGELTAAGDAAQAVRRLRGAGRKNLEDLRRELPALRVVRLRRSHRAPAGIVRAARAAAGAAPAAAATGKAPVRVWRCRSERAQGQAVAAEVERLVATVGVAPELIAVLVPSLSKDATVLGAALEERGVPYRLEGAASYFRRPEVRDVLAWLRLLADPDDSGAAVRALSRPPVELRSVDIARLTQLARRRKLDMVSAIPAALEGPQLSPEGRDQVRAFLALHRRASQAFEEMRPDLFVHRLIERIGVRRRQVFSASADTAERLRGLARLGLLAAAYMRREPQATPRDFVAYVAAVAEAGLPDEDLEPDGRVAAVRVLALEDAAGAEWDHVFVLGLDASAERDPVREQADSIPDALLKERLPPDVGGRLGRLVHVAMTRARRGVVLSWAEDAADGRLARPAPALEQVAAAAGAAEEVWEEELFGPAETLHSTFRMLRDELLDSVALTGARLGEMRLDTYLDVSQGLVRHLELLKLAALMERAKDGEPVAEALPYVNELVLQAATPEQRELFRASALDAYLCDTDSAQRRRAEALGASAEASLEPFIPRRGAGLMLSASDIETYRRCPLKYKFARVFRIPQEPTINQRFGILVHQVLERFHTTGGGSRESLMHLFEASWRRCGFGERNDERQFRRRAESALQRYWELDRERAGEPVWFERSFTFRLGPHVLRGRVDRVDRLADGGYELIDYKTGRAKTAGELREDLQLSLYQMGAREAWRLETSAQSYYYVLENEKVPVEHSEAELERVRATVAEIAEGIAGQKFEPRPEPDLCAACDYRIVCPAAEA